MRASVFRIALAYEGKIEWHNAINGRPKPPEPPKKSDGSLDRKAVSDKVGKAMAALKQAASSKGR